MQISQKHICLALVLAPLVVLAQPQPSPSVSAVAVTVDNFIRAESDLYFSGTLKDSGGVLGTFNHRREVAPIDHQTVIRLKRSRSCPLAVIRP